MRLDSTLGIRLLSLSVVERDDYLLLPLTFEELLIYLVDFVCLDFQVLVFLLIERFPVCTFNHMYSDRGVLESKFRH